MDKNKNGLHAPSAIKLPIFQDEPCCNAVKNDVTGATPRLDQPFITGTIPTKAGNVPQVQPVLTRRDRWGSVKARLGIDRMNYKVDPGLYALGNPDTSSPVLVTANYKMSFDRLRGGLPGLNAWILVLDTKGINVWCAAGKGTFGTEELIRRIAASGLQNIVSHRNLILPQLGAPGIAAHSVKKFSGFRVNYGPIRAEDLPAYLTAGMKATAAMRIMTFPLKDRAVLIPIEFVEAMKAFLIIAPVLLFLGGIAGSGSFGANAASHGLFAVTALLSAVIGGTVLNPLLLPYLPGRAFSVKGFFLGFVIAFFLLYLRGSNMQLWSGRAEAAAWFLIIPAVSGYLAMNFTGCSTYTSLSGVKREMHWALPVQIAAGAAGIVVWFASRLIAGE